MEQDDEKIMAKLDSQRPDWFIEWADQTDLTEFALGRIRRDVIRARVGRKIINSVIHAAYCAGVIHLND